MKETTCYNENSKSARSRLHNTMGDGANHTTTTSTTNLLQFLYVKIKLLL